MTSPILRSARPGLVLPVALTFSFAAAVTAAAVVSYVNYAQRATQRFLAKDACRLAAQSALEAAKLDLNAAFRNYLYYDTKVGIFQAYATAYDWFDESNVRDRRTTIGIDKPPHAAAVRFANPTELNGCRVWVSVARGIEHAPNGTFAEVPLVATAEKRLPNGQTERATLLERVRFGSGPSAVFDNAYFVNNYGWMSFNSSPCIINGNFRANANCSLKGSGIVVNGEIFACENAAFGADGSVELADGPRIYGVDDYRANSGSRARPDRANYAYGGSFDAPDRTQPLAPVKLDPQTGARLSGTVSGTSGEAVVHEKADLTEMPFVGDLTPYIAYAQNQSSTLGCPAYTYVNAAGKSVTVPAQTVKAHHEGNGPSGQGTLADKGALVLVGTKDNPIRLNGPVVVDSDIIIKGYVTGQGTLYSGRNVHIVGDIRYVNPPTWQHPDQQSEATEKANDAADMLALVAKGNVVMGNYTADYWKTFVGNNIASVTKTYACDASDASIGYPDTFDGNYLSVEQTGSKAKVRTRQVTDAYGRTTLQSYTATDRHYYESVCDDALIASLTDQTVTDPASPYYGYSIVRGGVNQVDAIIYNNHGNMGTHGTEVSPDKSKPLYYGNRQWYWNAAYGQWQTQPVGGRYSYLPTAPTYRLPSAQHNGSLVCRNELLTTLSNGLVHNWDSRLSSKRPSHSATQMGLPAGNQAPYTTAWQEVPDSLNEAYPKAN